MRSFFSRKILFSNLAILAFAALFSRALFLEYTDLSDPTETRYALVAQEMLDSGNWLTPQLPIDGINTPYLGKPPLHFWLTAVSYEIFGADEWSARIPSFIATTAMTLTVLFFGIRYFSSSIALGSILVFTSTGMIFLLAGASVTDLTLSSFITLSVFFAYVYLQSDKKILAPIFLSSIFTALAFLTKGPIGLVLSAFPFLLWSMAKRDFAWIRTIPWFRVLSIIFIITAPWFILSEMSNPGFIKYFFWNENIARYLFKNYGDKFGTGHRYPIGMSWVFLLLAFFPWTLFLFGFLNRKFRFILKEINNENQHLLFVICWAISAPLFFTFVKQLHPLYLLPAIPALSILLSSIICNQNLYNNSIGLALRFLNKLRTFDIITIFYLLFSLTGLVLSVNWKAHLLTLIIVTGGLFAIRFTNSKNHGLKYISQQALVLYSIYLMSFATLGPYIDSRISSRDSVQRITKQNSCTLDPSHKHTIGTSYQNKFSLYWLSKNWETEIGEEVNIRYVDPQEGNLDDLCFFLVKEDSQDDFHSKLSRVFPVFSNQGDWITYQKADQFVMK